MNTRPDTLDKAAKLLRAANLARYRGDHERADELTQEALQIESETPLAVLGQGTSETRIMP